MPDLATEFTALDPHQQIAYAHGTIRAYQQAMDAIAEAYAHPAGLTAAFQTIRGQYYEATTLFSVEGVLDDC